jgi:hypothetical protein
MVKVGPGPLVLRSNTVNLRPALPMSVRQLEARRRRRARRDLARNLRRRLASSETWGIIVLVAIGLVLALWLTTHALDALTNPVQAALDLVRLGPKSRH